MGIVWTDPMIWDDQALVINVRDRGLVIISGCSHAALSTSCFTPASDR